MKIEGSHQSQPGSLAAVDDSKSLPLTASQRAVKNLLKLLADTRLLMMKTDDAHRILKGDLFRDERRLLVVEARRLHKLSNAFRARLRELGQPAPGSINAINRHARLSHEPTDSTASVASVLSELLLDNKEFTIYLHLARDLGQQLGDRALDGSFLDQAIAEAEGRSQLLFAALKRAPIIRRLGPGGTRSRMTMRPRRAIPSGVAHLSV